MKEFRIKEKTITKERNEAFADLKQQQSQYQPADFNQLEEQG